MDYYMASQMTTAIIDAYISVIKVAVGVGLLLSLLSIIGYWKVYKKAGQPGWGSIVPFYNTYLLYKITWGCGWIFLAPLVFSIVGAFFVDGIISSLLVIASVVLSCMTYYKTGTAFGKGVGFGIGLDMLYTYYFDPERTIGLSIGGTVYPQFLVSSDPEPSPAFAISGMGYIGVTWRLRGFALSPIELAPLAFMIY